MACLRRENTYGSQSVEKGLPRDLRHCMDMNANNRGRTATANLTWPGG